MVKINNNELEFQVLLSQGKGNATVKLHQLIYLLSNNLSYRFPYKSEEDRQDIISDGYMYTISRYIYFNEEKGAQAFSFFTEICKRRFAEYFKKQLQFKGMSGVYEKAAVDVGYYPISNMLKF